MDEIFWADLQLGVLLQVIGCLFATTPRAKAWVFLATTWVLIEMLWHVQMEQTLGKALAAFAL